MEKFGKGLAVALVGCAALGLTACKDNKKPEEKPAASAPAPASTEKAAAPAEAAKPATSEPAKPAEPAPAPATEKKSEAPVAPATDSMAAAAPAADTPKPIETASTSAPAAESAKPAAPAETKTADATPAPSADAAKPAEVAAPAEDIKDRTAPPDPVSELAKEQGFKFEDGRYRNKDDEPQPIVTKDYMVDWGTWNGFRRYHDACHVCHGPNALGSTFAPALADSLKTMDYNTFVATVSSGKRENKGGTEFVMPAFGTDKNIMCYLDDIYTYIKARSFYMASEGKTGMPPGRPNNREDISDEARKAADDCTG